MTDDPNAFVSPGTVTLTPEVLALAKAFAQHAGGIGSGRWIFVFDWATSRVLENRKLGTRVDLGPGLDISAARPGDVPPEAVCEADGFRYAIQIPCEVVAAAAHKIIEIDRTNVATAVRLI